MLFRSSDAAINSTQKCESGGDGIILCCKKSSL